MKTDRFLVTDIPFSKHIHLAASNREGYIFMLEEASIHLNHIAVFHAGVIFSLGESTSGEFLLRKFKNLEWDIIPVIRKAEIKYSKPANGTLYSNADFLDKTYKEVAMELSTRNRVTIKVRSDIYNAQGTRIAFAVYEWFVVVNITA
ncbi:YiiD C-terminal domain-containing protein [Bacteroidota bacterium]